MNMSYTMEKTPLSDFDIQAYIDNELEWERAKTVLAQIEADPKLRQRYESLLALKHQVQNWWRETRHN